MIHYYWKEVSCLAGRRIGYWFSRYAKKEDPMDDQVNEMKDNFTENYFESYR